MWKGAPALCVLGLAEIVAVRPPDANGDSWFTLRYTTGPLENPHRIAQLRADHVLRPVRRSRCSRLLPGTRRS